MKKLILNIPYTVIGAISILLGVLLVRLVIADINFFGYCLAQLVCPDCNPHMKYAWFIERNADIWIVLTGLFYIITGILMIVRTKTVYRNTRRIFIAAIAAPVSGIALSAAIDNFNDFFFVLTILFIILLIVTIIQTIGIFDDAGKISSEDFTA